MQINTPWIDSPFFDEELSLLKDDPVKWTMALEYHTIGYVKVHLDDIDIEGIKTDVNGLISSGAVKTQEGGYHYSDSPRVFEAWRSSQAVLDLARHPKILETLKFLYRRDPIPFQTINFLKGSNQPLHSDAIHFHTLPFHWMAGVWVALEDMDEDNGTLQYVPGSHSFPVYNLQDLGLPLQEYGKQFEAYRKYEEFIQKVVDSNYGLKAKPLICKAGTAFIWHSNLFHGGCPIKDPNRTRWSQATHYYFGGAERYYSPLFSDLYKGIISDKDLSKKDILNHVIG